MFEKYNFTFEFFIHIYNIRIYYAKVINQEGNNPDLKIKY